jgi:hypothetical protein
MFEVFTEEQPGGKYMISYQRLFREIERYTGQAKTVQNEQQYRELLSAIRALCDVALNTQSEHQPVKEMQSIQVAGHTRHVSQVQPPTSTYNLPSTKLEEDDANGESIFDF